MTCSVSSRFGLGSLQAARRNVRNSSWSGLLVYYNDKYNIKRVQNPARKRWYLKKIYGFCSSRLWPLRRSLPLWGKWRGCAHRAGRQHRIPRAQGVPRPRSHRQMSRSTCAAYLQIGTGTWRRRATPERIVRSCKFWRSFPCRWFQSSQPLKRWRSVRIFLHSVMTSW